MDIDESIHLVPYNEKWPKIFELEKERLQKALNQPLWYFEHIGSTSVLGLCSKPIVDIMIGVDSYPISEELINTICELGYLFHGEANVSGRLYFTLRGDNNFNLAVVLYKGEHWNNNIKFRDFLRNNPKECKEYEKVKFVAVNSGANKLLAYSNFKNKFISDILKN